MPTKTVKRRMEGTQKQALPVEHILLAGRDTATDGLLVHLSNQGVGAWFHLIQSALRTGHVRWKIHVIHTYIWIQSFQNWPRPMEHKHYPHIHLYTVISELATSAGTHTLSTHTSLHSHFRTGHIRWNTHIIHTYIFTQSLFKNLMFSALISQACQLCEERKEDNRSEKLKVF